MPILMRLSEAMSTPVQILAADTRINARAPETPKPPAGGFALSVRADLSLGELVTAACLVQADLLPLHFARVAGHESRFLEHPFQARVVLDERAGDAVAHGARLARLAAAVDVDADVEARERVGELQRLAHDHAPRLAREELVDGPAVDRDRAL